MTIDEAAQGLIRDGLINRWWYGEDEDCVCIEWADGEIQGYADEATAILVLLAAEKASRLLTRYRLND